MVFFHYSSLHLRSRFRNQFVHFIIRVHFNCDQRIIVDDKRESLQEEVKSPALYSKAYLIGEEIGYSYA